MRKSQIWRGLSALTAMVLTTSVVGTGVVSDHRTDIDKFLGTTSSKVVTDDEVDASEMYTYTSDYASTTELVTAMADIGERMSEEGSVLLKNNGTLPLTAEETGKVSLLGFSSYFPNKGAILGPTAAENHGTDADTVDLVGALEARGFTLNDTLKGMYTSDGLKAIFKSEVATWTGTMEYLNLTAPSVGGVYTDKEPSIAELDAANGGWRDSLNASNVILVTISRAGSENADYTPGEAGVNPADGLNQADPLGLSDDERALIAAAAESKKASGGKLIILLNNGNPMEIDELAKNDDIDAILQVGTPGSYGFYGVADILKGDVNPSGHLTDTYAVDNSISPAAMNYGDLQWANANPATYINDAIVEAEGIYTGYKYYETRYADVVLGQGGADAEVGSTGGAWNYENEVTYTFGYGLSYTTFEQTIKSVDVDLNSRTAKVTVDVKNTGDVAGKDAVQLYVSVPYTDYDREHLVEKSAIQLLDFGKTGIIEPGKTETVELTADLYYMASWDSTADNAAGTKGTYILDDGDYYFTVGNGAHEALNNVLAAQGKTTADGMTADGSKDNVITWTLDKFDSTTFAQSKNGTNVENQLADMDLNYWMPGTVTYLTRSDWAGTFPKTYSGLTATDEMLAIMDNDVYEYQTGGEGAVTWGAQNGLTLANLKGVTDPTDERWDLLIDQMQLSEALIRTAFGGTSTKSIASITSPEVIQNDGPTGFANYPIGQYGTKDASTGDPCVLAENDPNAGYMGNIMANNIVVAQTFNKELANEWGETVGNYSLWSNCAILWGISANIHRLPYCARNLEYYSEDPVLSSFMAAEQTVGEQKYGVIAAVKHFAFNDTEVNRTGVAPFMTEQKAREGDIRAMQSAIEDAKCLGVMTAYNRAGVYTDNSHTGLIKNILHGEFGFYGLISEDFIMDPGYVCLKEAVQNGVTMSCNTGDNSLEAVAAYYPAAGWDEATVGADATVQQALKEAMKMQNYAIANSNAMDGLVASSHLVTVKTWYDNLLMGLTVGSAILFALCAFMLFRSRKD